MVAVVLTKNWDHAKLALDSSNIASAEAIPGGNFGAVVHLFNAVGTTAAGIQYSVKDIPVLETPAEIASIQNKASREGLATAMKANRA